MLTVTELTARKLAPDLEELVEEEEEPVAVPVLEGLLPEAVPDGELPSLRAPVLMSASSSYGYGLV